MLIKTASVLASLLLLGSSTSIAADSVAVKQSLETRLPDATTAQVSSERSLPNFTARRIQRDLSQRLNVPFNTIQIQSASNRYGLIYA